MQAPRQARRGTRSSGRRVGDGQRVAANRVVYERLVDHVERRLAAGRFESAMGFAQVAAAYAASNPNGLLRDLRLEAQLDLLAVSAMPELGDVRAAAVASRRRVLHVLTEVHLVGGHRRMAVRWMRTDEGSDSTVAVTRPLGPLPPDVVSAPTTGHVGCLDDRSLVVRASQLRVMATAADLVVCHTHPDDPVPAVAFGGTYSGPPVLLVNHADHVFWLHTGAVAIVVNLRKIGAAAAHSHRNYPVDRCLLLPTPVDPPRSPGSRPGARSAFGFLSDQTVLLTLARGSKYKAHGSDPGFCAVLAPVLEAHPAAVLLAVGPDPQDGDWASLIAQHPGRVVLPGLLADPGPALAAADVYLDSFPFGSVTSMLEAAAEALPVVTLRPQVGWAELLSSSGPLDDVVVIARDRSQFAEELVDLITNDARRRRLGELAASAIRAKHLPDVWHQALNALYDTAVAPGPAAPSAWASDQDDAAAYAEALLSVEPGSPLLWTLLNALQHMDACDRRIEGVRTLAARIYGRTSGSNTARTDALLSMRSRSAWERAQRGRRAR